MSGDAPASSNDQRADARRLLKAGRVAEALAAAQRAVEDAPDDIEALYLLAVCQRYDKQYDAAAKTLGDLLSHAPGHGRAHQERGHLASANARSAEALAAFLEAVRCNPALLASWKAIASLTLPSSEQGHVADSHIRRLTSLPPALISVESMMYDGKLFEAEQLCRRFLQANPKSVDGMRLLAQLGVKLSVLDDAEFLLESAVTFAPDNLEARFDYVGVLHRRQKFEQAFEEARKLRDMQPEHVAFRSVYASQALAIGSYDIALAELDDLAATYPALAGNHLVRGHALKTVGKSDAAVEAYRTAYRTKPDFGDAFWSLANLKTYRFTDDEVAQMQAQEAQGAIGDDDRVAMCFALGKAFEDRDDQASSFDYYERGNRLKKATLRYDADRMSAELQAQRDVVTADLLQELGPGGATDAAPIFIVGLPRAGSTLLEQILASHSQVEGTLELPNILARVHKLNGRRKLSDDPRYPSVLRELTTEQRRQFGEEYIEDTRIHRKGAPFFTDKMPNNFRHIGLIHLILPNAKIIDARRAPLDCCFSGFKQLFAEGQEFTYGLEEIGRYYHDYVELMRHWDTVLPGKILRVQYEDVVDDLEVQVRRILAHCDLPFEQACVDFHQTTRSVRTASSEQVRQPLYQSGMNQWRPFEAWLDPLKAALGPALTEYNE